MLFILIVLGTLALDQGVKWWTVQNISLGETLFDNPILSLTHIRNTGAAWSIMEGRMIFFYIITAVAVVVLLTLIYKNRNDSKWLTVGLSFILSGAVGNLIDRVRLQYVIDMFQLELFNFPIFNIADVCIVIGVICVFIYIFFIAEEE